SIARTSVPLPLVYRSPSTSSFSRRIAPASYGPTTFELRQVAPGSVTVPETTYLVVSLKNGAPGSSSTVRFGHACANISKVVRPSRTPRQRPVTEASRSPIRGSKPYSRVQVGVSITPSRVMNSCTQIAPIRTSVPVRRGARRLSVVQPTGRRLEQKRQLAGVAGPDAGRRLADEAPQGPGQVGLVGVAGPPDRLGDRGPLAQQVDRALGAHDLRDRGARQPGRAPDAPLDRPGREADLPAGQRRLDDRVAHQQARALEAGDEDVGVVEGGQLPGRAVQPEGALARPPQRQRAVDQPPRREGRP